VFNILFNYQLGKAY